MFISLLNICILFEKILYIHLDKSAKSECITYWYFMNDAEAV